MSSIIFIFACVILVLVVMAKIPGLEHMVRPSIDLIFTFIKMLAENSVSWLIWVFKNMMKSHVELINHLIKPAEDLDPLYAVKKRNEG